MDDSTDTISNHCQFLIDNLIPEKSITLMLAPVDAGISVLGIDLMLHVAAGRSWMGRKVLQGSVLSYGFDGPICDELCEAWRLQKGLSALPTTYLANPELDLEDSSSIQRLCQHAEFAFKKTKEPVRLIGIDAFSSPVRAGDGKFRQRHLHYRLSP